jgi:hypothetical protein
MAEVSEAIRSSLLENLMARVEQARYPSWTMLNTIEGLLETPQETARYARVLLRDVEQSPFPSITIIRRLEALL